MEQPFTFFLSKFFFVELAADIEADVVLFQSDFRLISQALVNLVSQLYDYSDKTVLEQQTGK